jgi:pimeloyl-ACP methyl ester carboxylesterase/O-acetyl-ADP-ribose deacetylase (regulator of RNase III)
MAKLNHTHIARMDWDAFEAHLQPAKRGAKRNAAEEQALRDYFGDEYKELQRLVDHARFVRERSQALGNVVFLHGIMGSNLSTVEQDGDEDLVWVNVLRLAGGQLERLKLAPDGRHEADKTASVRATALDKRTYARAILWLRARWNVHPFAYDWRRDMDESADALARFIREQFKGEPVHLVAHSMGGLVCRNFIRRHKDAWQAMQDREGHRGGRLVMLGTPNFGSFAIPQALTGVEKMVKWLAAIDLDHNLRELLEILDSFVGSYQLLPAPMKIPPALQALYRRESWGAFPISEAHLRRAFQFHLDLDNDGAIDSERMTYIAGCNQETLTGMNIVSPGEFEYLVSLAGDGRVPHDLGLLKGVPTYYVEEGHGDLPRNEKVLAAIDELLERGNTSTLPNQPPISRAAPREGSRWRRSASEQQTIRLLKTIAERAHKQQANPEDLLLAEDLLTRATIGRSRQRQKTIAKPERMAALQRTEQIRLRLQLIHGDITRVEAPVIVAGHYKGVDPTGAEGAIDRKVGGWISRAVELGILGGDLGRLFFIPVMTKQIAAKAAVLAGMGEAGRFTREDLRYLATNITYGASALQQKSFATVLIGAGGGGLPRERALKALLEGVSDALQRVDKTERLEQLLLVENDREAYNDLSTLLDKFEQEKVIVNLKLDISRKALPHARRERRVVREPRTTQQAKPTPDTRITIERDGDVFQFSALSAKAVIPVRRVSVQSYFATEAAARLMESESLEEQIRYGQLLYTYLFPEDFRQLFDEEKPATLILDRSSAAFPWEMACFQTAGKPVFFGSDLQLTRQFRTMLASAPGIMPALNRMLRILVIADPAPEPEWQLPGARREGRKVVEVLESAKQNGSLQLDVISRIGAEECDPLEILSLILNEEFDIVHFAGHGVFEEREPDRSGWVFGANRIFSAREIFRVRRVPRLVFSNACFSAVLREGKALAADEMNVRLAGLAEAFFERGVQNYIGAGWPVGDEPAVKFAETFYQRILDGAALGAALATARREILEQGSTWGAYHHYGQVDATLLAQGGR